MHQEVTSRADLIRLIEERLRNKGFAAGSNPAFRRTLRQLPPEEKQEVESDLRQQMLTRQESMENLKNGRSRSKGGFAHGERPQPKARPDRTRRSLWSLLQAFLRQGRST